QEVLGTGAKWPAGKHRLAHAYQAIALHALGRPEDARPSLTRLASAVHEWTKDMLTSPVASGPLFWSEWLNTQYWYREATTVVTRWPPPDDPRLAILRQRGIEVTKGDVHTYMAASRKAVERKAWDEAADSYATALEKLPLSVPPGPASNPFHVEMVQQPEVFEKLVALRPQFVPLWWARAHVLANRQQSPQAADHYARALQVAVEFGKLSDEEQLRKLNQWRGGNLTQDEQKLLFEKIRQGPTPVNYALYLLAVVRLLAGDEKGYQEACAR